jgi:tRNA 2-thiouridine synthesizing protein A
MTNGAKANLMPDQTLDCDGLLCPLPVLRARKVLLGMQPGQVLRVSSTDPMAIVDLPHFCVDAGHEYLGSTINGSSTIHSIRRGA